MNHSGRKYNQNGNKNDSIIGQSEQGFSFSEEISGHGTDFIEDEIFKKQELEYKEVAVASGGNIAVDMDSSGLWIVESPIIYQGGHLEWDQSYRIRHMTSGKYLKISHEQANEYTIELSSEIDGDLLFKFTPMKNLLREDQKKLIAKDSYFRIQHVSTKKWLSFHDKALDLSH